MKLQKFSTPSALAKMARANLTARQITELITLLQEVQQEPPPATIAEIIYSAAAMEFGVTLNGIKSEQRDRPLVDARRIVGILLLKYNGTDITRTADIMQKNHATIIHYKKKHRDLMKTDALYRQKYERLELFFELVG